MHHKLDIHPIPEVDCTGYGTCHTKRTARGTALLLIALRAPDL